MTVEQLKAASMSLAHKLSPTAMWFGVSRRLGGHSSKCFYLPKIFVQPCQKIFHRLTPASTVSSPVSEQGHEASR
jgi:hypothetical protein